MQKQTNPTIRKLLTKQLDFIERGGRVQRMHTVPTLHPQNVAAHSFGVAWWCWLLTNGEPTARLLMAALQHDIPENVTGDIPAPTKRTLAIGGALEIMEDHLLAEACVGHFPLTAEEQRILKLADVLELAQHCIRERSLGNRTKALAEMFINACNYAKEVASRADNALDTVAIEIINDTWSAL